MNLTAFIAMGSNIGDRELNLLLAVSEAGKLPDSRITALSSFYDTEPSGPPQDNFLNAVIRIETAVQPLELLWRLQRIETEIFNRKRSLKWGPRRMDLDILLYDDLVITSPWLTVPHPLMHQRRFVLAPLAEIAPDEIHPASGKRISDLLSDLVDDTRVTMIKD